MHNLICARSPSNCAFDHESSQHATELKS